MASNRRTFARPLWQRLILGLLSLLLVASSAAGGWTYFHFYWQPTGVTFQSTGKRVYRAQLVDMVLEMAVKQNATPPPTPPVVAPPAGPPAFQP